MNRLLAAALLIAACCASPLAAAQALPVDDTGTQVLGGNVRMKWDSVLPRPGQPSTMTGRMTVLVRLDVSSWRGRSGRIYKELGPQATGPLFVQWTTRGVLLPGQLRDGERSLVYQGPITADRLEDTLLVTLQADGNHLPQQSQLSFTFEIELESP